MKKLSLLLLILISGCAVPEASMSLLGMQEQINAQHAASYKQLYDVASEGNSKTLALLDASFASDIKSVASGKITTADGKPQTLTPEWVISTYTGTVAARNIVQNNQQRLNAFYQANLDNIKTSSDATKMTRDLIMQSWAIDEKGKFIIKGFWDNLVAPKLVPPLTSE